MKLAALIAEQNILVHMEEQTYAGALDALLQTFGENLGRLSPEKVRERLLGVEAELPVAPGHGVRIPHARLAGLSQMLLAIGTSNDGVLINEESGERAHLIFLILTPKTESTGMLQTMSSIARLVSSEENRKALVSTTTAQRVLRILEESGIQVKKAIVAGDLMNPAEYKVAPGDSLREVAATLAASGEEGIPVVNDKGELEGDVSTRMVIEVGLPRYMNLVSDSRLLSEFEPFEAFYKKEDTATASEIMDATPLVLKPDTPVEIAAHEMLTKHSERAYVVDDKQLVGVVYRKNIVRRVLTL